ncbi:SDR family oxidoreductase [Aspergillus niger CBS 101883]|uniref:Short chain oxidoreductase n=1 Tax=Aspergillus niger ATCC 13496 TaxID=1353008 RepID=A0A370C2E4_ASPNG|nr:short chain oxidoreductase (CsgA) [Aspergillus niger CBS 513.88]XP_025452932.1 short chain oxidoreductase [Aspergillus niger CBS 101883]PYH54877.1 short chain oxidoreductase [Aspergillus niger CBS 101883]RDH20515.1 short chain oxidoreductase [Aspergillus niger ATCC 13496]|eukprot:XP_001398322.2 short chain oxidoreductase (CsgA) [Aspergillus niger CBS 513.88]
MSTYLVTGASRGIGLELVRQLAAKTSETVQTISAAARTSGGPLFQELLQQHPDRVIFVPLDVTEKESVKNAVTHVATALNGKGLDVLINNAGVMTPGTVENMDDLEDTLRVNVGGVHLVTREFLPLLRNGNKKRIVNISTSVGSIQLQPTYRAMPTPSYKISKAALNMLTVLYSQELEAEGFTVFCVSPGWLKTDMGSDDADLPVDTGVSAVLDAVLTTGKEKNGRFLNILVPGWENNPGMNQYDGKELPW